MRWMMVMTMLAAGVLSANDWTRTEKEFLKTSDHNGFYPTEKVKVIEVQGVKELGQLVAYRFLEWAKTSPRGVVALPTGKTPEMFIETMKHLKANWQNPALQETLKEYGLAGPMPDLSQLKLVQLDEFYPIDPVHVNSFSNYIKQYYLPILGLKEENVLLMDMSSRGILKERGIENVFPNGKVDLTLWSRVASNQREQWQRQALEEAQTFARQYEAKIHEWGGIGFFLGGIGLDGHIAFNISGTPFTSYTHLTKLPFLEAAQSAVSLGGMEFSRDRVAMTIGLETITANPQATLIVIAAGEGKADAVKEAVEGKQQPGFPASKLQSYPNARFYVTRGAAKELTDRKLEDVESLSITDEMVDEVIIDIALAKKKELKNLTAGDIKRDIRGGALVRRLGTSPFALKDATYNRLKAKVEKGITPPEGKRILHTSPHHDDVMLSYFGVLQKLLGQNGNLFLYLTSGFNAVTDSYMKKLLTKISTTQYDSYDALEAPYAIVLARMLRAARANDQEALNTYESIILLRHMGIVYNTNDLDAIRKQASWLLNEYFARKSPGSKDQREIQVLKGAMRESEEDRHMTVQGVPVRDVIHMRSNFYTGDYFNPLPSIEKDAEPVVEYYKAFKPHIITVALDPEGTGPDTHYKVLQVITQALKMTDLAPKIWGYRNVWHRFPVAEANLITPVSEEQLKQMHECFMMCYTTQKDASFPTLEYDGPFSEVSVEIQRNQFAMLKQLLGQEYFDNHKNEAIRKAAGFVFLKEMNKEELFQYAQDLSAGFGST